MIHQFTRNQARKIIYYFYKGGTIILFTFHFIFTKCFYLFFKLSFYLFLFYLFLIYLFFKFLKRSFFFKLFFLKYKCSKNIKMKRGQFRLYIWTICRVVCMAMANRGRCLSYGRLISATLRNEE